MTILVKTADSAWHSQCDLFHWRAIPCGAGHSPGVGKATKLEKKTGEKGFGRLARVLLSYEGVL